MLLLIPGPCSDLKYAEPSPPPPPSPLPKKKSLLQEVYHLPELASCSLATGEPTLIPASGNTPAFSVRVVRAEGLHESQELFFARCIKQQVLSIVHSFRPEEDLLQQPFKSWPCLPTVGKNISWGAVSVATLGQSGPWTKDPIRKKKAVLSFNSQQVEVLRGWVCAGASNSRESCYSEGLIPSFCAFGLLVLGWGCLDDWSGFQEP